MKQTIKIFATLALASLAFVSCEKQFDPQGNTVTERQAADAPGAYDNFVNAITSSLCGQFTYNGSDDTTPWDFGYPSFMLQRDVMGQDIVCNSSSSEWYASWYACSVGLGPTYAVCQVPWTYYYGWIQSCNTVISMAGPEPDEQKIVGAGIAYAMRAFFYMDLARMFAPETYAKNPEAETVPIVDENTTPISSTNNPRATNKDMWAFILSDLDKAEEYLEGYERADIYTPDQSVVYGLKARAYLVMEDWANAKLYAEKAMEGYDMMSEDEYLSHTNGFNTPTSSWMFGCTYKSSDPNITLNDGDSSWGSQMIVEVSPSRMGYSANYVGPKCIDAHLYSTIPETDFRRKLWIDPALDELETEEEIIEALKAYTDDPEGVFQTGYIVSEHEAVGYIPLKFRPKDGEHADQYHAFTVALPFMRVEEMKLIQAEAAGMLNQADGIALLTAFAKTRDANYVYGKHTDAYYNTSTGTFRNEIWWQRRVEFWGEGLATFDIKRLNKGIIRSYPGSNHPEDYQWNSETVPQWMHLCIIQTETNYNKACTNNPTPVAPVGKAPEFTNWTDNSGSVE